jgi:hypothetical protein
MITPHMVEAGVSSLCESLQAGMGSKDVVTEVFKAMLDAALPYGKMCRKPGLCAGRGYCPLDPTCGD